MIGMKMTVATSMTKRVKCEDELSQTVSEERGSIDEGRMKGEHRQPHR